MLPYLEIEREAFGHVREPEMTLDESVEVRSSPLATAGETESSSSAPETAAKTVHVSTLVEGLLGRIRIASHGLPVVVNAEIEEASELLAVTALHAAAAAEESRGRLERAARPFEVDALTGLPNRLLFRDRFSQALAHARRQNSRVGVLFIDLDHFKEINDEYGHNVGDLIIQYVANCLKHAGRDVDTVCRHGGDEFLILLSEIGDTVSAALFAEKILEALREPVRIADATFTVSASIGISLYPDDGADQDALIQRADAAMYVAKRNGSRIAFASPHLQLISASNEHTADMGMRDPVGLLELALSDAHTEIANLRARNTRLERDLLGAEREQAKANEAKQYQSHLLNVVAHELRNTLAPLSSAAEVLTLLRTGPSMMDRLELVLKRQIGHISRMLNDLLDVSRLNMGRLTVDHQRVDLAEVIEASMLELATEFAKREQSVRVSVETVSPVVAGDTVRLRQVVTTLLERVSASLSKGASMTVSLYEHEDLLFVAIADGQGSGDQHDASAAALDLNSPHTSSATGTILTVAVMVVIELLKSHGGHLSVSQSDNGDVPRLQIAFPRP